MGTKVITFFLIAGIVPFAVMGYFGHKGQVQH